MDVTPQKPSAVLDYATAPEEKRYTCGTLSYTKIGLTILFAWLLWGDFCFTLMETVVPSVLPLKLKALGASNKLMSVILTTLPMVLNMTICPWVSFKSDRYRGRWGRRIPFILWTMPFLTISLVMLGWSESIAVWAQKVVPALAQMAPATVTIILIATFMVVYQFFNMFVNSVFWYLFNDVVPPQFLARFMGMFRMMGTLAGSGYSYFVFKYAETNMREIFTGGAILYFVGFGAMCLFVKEGEYPPPPDEGRARGLISDIKALGKQCFSARFYWWFYLMNAFGSVAGLAGFANVFMNKQMGLTLEDMGQLGAMGGIATFCATYFTAVFVDRWHPLRISTYVAIFTAVTGFSGWIWVAVTLPGKLYFWLSMGGMLVALFGTCLADACDITLFMRVLPKSFYGQFCSANALIRSGMRLLGSLVVGVFLDLMVNLCGGDFGYRWMFLWPWFFNILRAIFICMGYREWKRLGADDNYRPPAPWTESGYEEVADKVASVPTKPRIVMASLWLGVAAAVINVLLVLVFMVFMQRHELYHAWHWYAWYLLPAKAIVTLLTYWQLASVRRDISDRDAGKAPRYGLPHHGVFMVNAIQGLIYFPVFWYQTFEMIKLNMDRELILFGVASILSSVAALVGTQIIRIVEREAQPGAPLNAVFGQQQSSTGTAAISS